MIRSMTAFARRERQIQGGVLIWELRTVNHRYLEAVLRLPDDYRALETSLRERIAAAIKRGKLDGLLRFQPHDLATTEIPLDEDMIKTLAGAIVAINKVLDQPARVNALDLLRWPGVIKAEICDQDVIQAELYTLLDEALLELTETRVREGVKLREMIEQRCAGIAAQVASARKRLPEVAARMREKLHARLAELETEIDAPRVAQEFVLWAQRMDVEEELDRIEAHLSEIRRILQQDEPVGRRLDFLMQELHREANTLGSKSADVETTRASVEMKVLIEQMREQVQNIE